MPVLTNFSCIFHCCLHYQSLLPQFPTIMISKHIDTAIHPSTFKQSACNMQHAISSTTIVTSTWNNLMIKNTSVHLKQHKFNSLLIVLVWTTIDWYVLNQAQSTHRMSQESGFNVYIHVHMQNHVYEHTLKHDCWCSPHTRCTLSPARTCPVLAEQLCEQSTRHRKSFRNICSDVCVQRWWMKNDKPDIDSPNCLPPSGLH